MIEMSMDRESNRAMFNEHMALIEMLQSHKANSSFVELPNKIFTLVSTFVATSFLIQRK